MFSTVNINGVTIREHFQSSELLSNTAVPFMEDIKNVFLLWLHLQEVSDEENCKDTLWY